MEKGFNLVPKAKTTSALDINSIAAFDPLYPRGPTASGWLPGKLSLCWYPEQTGESNFSANFTQSSIAPPITTPAPDNITGNFVSDNLAACSTVYGTPSLSF